MKQCPVCQSTYTDDSLVFCLNDGGRLFSPSNSETTRELNFNDRRTFSGERKDTENFNSAPTVVARKKTGGLNLLIILTIFGFIALVMGAIAVTRYFVLKRNAERAEILKSGQEPPDEKNSDETRELREKLTNLEKQIERQRAADKKATPAETPASSSANDYSISGTVDSPNDGFLALRSAPNHKNGSQILQIPHGTVIYVYNCRSTTTVGERRGRWCETAYGGKTGWIFDGFLIY